MFIRMTFVHFKPGTMPDVQALYNDVVIPKMKEQPGLRFVHFLEQVDDRDAGISIAAWDTRQDAETYERSGVYPQLLGRFEQWYTMPPELRSYEVTVSSDPILLRIF
jgi:heme-degrading monooxygenase HmoA